MGRNGQGFKPFTRQDVHLQKQEQITRSTKKTALNNKKRI